MLTTVIMGAGVAGRELHHRSLRRVRPDQPVVFVDPVPQQDVPWVPDFDAFTERNRPSDAVVHICTPTPTHVPILGELIERGVRRFVLEKPIASSSAELDLLGNWVAEVPDLTILPMAVWPYSAAVQTARDFVRLTLAGSDGDGLVLHMAQEKFRRVDSTRNRGGTTSAFDVELPHQALLARHLLGPVDEVEEAECWPAPWAAHDPSSGGARLRLRHRNGAVSHLSTDLAAAERRRHIRLTAGTGTRWCEVGLPLSRDRPWSRVRRNGMPQLRYDDRPIDAFLDHAYGAFEERAGLTSPTVPFDHHIDAADLILTVRAAARRIRGADDARTVLHDTPSPG
ncbi:Gfo/Idh/MocA family oxidoreductase [Streptomyces cyaneus]|uniref:Gfo/Idh/MocA family oxidoreductase n=1 Tax=Streptomyces cyaneus TaxID=1904 RepID=UPI0013E38106|nr:Gfo/Idh/MocA family oxidoreductase [Streptomyces cyaneus]